MAEMTPQTLTPRCPVCGYAPFTNTVTDADGLVWIVCPRCGFKKLAPTQTV